MARQFYTNKEAQERHAELSEMIVQAGGPKPPALAKFVSSQEAVATLSAMEAQIQDLHAAEDRRRAALNATAARLNEAEAKRKLTEAKAASQTAVAAATASQTPHLDAFMKLSGCDASAYFKEHGKEIQREQHAANLRAANPGAKVHYDPKSKITSTTIK